MTKITNLFLFSPTSSIKISYEKSEIYLSPDVYTGLNSDAETDKLSPLVFCFQGPLTFLSAATFKTDVNNKILKPLEALHFEKTKQDPNNNSSNQTPDDVLKFDGIQIDGHDNLAYERTDDIELKNCKTKVDSLEKQVELWNDALILDMSQIIHIDVTGIEMIEELQNDLKGFQCKLLLASCSISVLSTLERAKIIPEKIAKSECFLSVHDAVIASKTMLTS